MSVTLNTSGVSGAENFDLLEEKARNDIKLVHDTKALARKILGQTGQQIRDHDASLKSRGVTKGSKEDTVALTHIMTEHNNKLRDLLARVKAS